MNCSPKNNSASLLSPGKSCGCICCVTLTLDSQSAFMQKFHCFREVPDLRLTLAVLCRQSPSGCTAAEPSLRLTLPESSCAADTVWTGGSCCHYDHTNQPFSSSCQMHRHTHLLIGDLGNFQEIY